MQVATMPMVAKTVRLGAGLNLEYVERGSRGGLPVVFLHGVTDSWGSLRGRAGPAARIDPRVCA